MLPPILPPSVRARGVTAVLGPTNTGKTHLAVERMLGHASGMIGLPLRLLAREIYDRIVKARGASRVALITGEEKIVPPRAVYFVCTVEAMPLSREVEFLAIDEIQLCADPERGHVFTHRLLHARGKYETMLLGAATMAPLVRRLLPAFFILVAIDLLATWFMTGVIRPQPWLLRDLFWVMMLTQGLLVALFVWVLISGIRSELASINRLADEGKAAAARRERDLDEELRAARG